MTTATRAETVADRIQQAIRNGVYVCGDRLIELTLAHQLEVSQNTIRDALRLLEAEGWVVKRARHGVYVREFSAEETAEVYALWIALETLVLDWTMERATRRDLNQLRRFIQEARIEALNGDFQQSMEAVFAFHNLIGAVSGRPQTRELLANLLNRIFLLEMMRQMRAPRSLHAHEARLLLHEKLVSLIEQHRSDDARALLQYLIQSDLDTLLPLIAGT